ncbi:hypothetical protein CLF_108583 [Clonorchis sinensis]|uniref:Uncharacterized protein n=1 Tax=Clonorchis sinensis TaxID=79923 RepID=G7YRS8_CLOSI|nr:hypothetical protein CLF_108583 [Clonorchis sinensis]
MPNIYILFQEASNSQGCLRHSDRIQAFQCTQHTTSYGAVRQRAVKTEERTKRGQKAGRSYRPGDRLSALVSCAHLHTDTDASTQVSDSAAFVAGADKQDKRRVKSTWTNPSDRVWQSRYRIRNAVLESVDSPVHEPLRLLSLVEASYLALRIDTGLAVAISSQASDTNLVDVEYADDIAVVVEQEEKMPIFESLEGVLSCKYSATREGILVGITEGFTAMWIPSRQLSLVSSARLIIPGRSIGRNGVLATGYKETQPANNFPIAVRILPANQLSISERTDARQPKSEVPATNKLMLNSECKLMIMPARSCYPPVVNEHYYYLTLCECRVHTKGRNDFGQFTQKQLHLFLLFEDENDVCMLHIGKAFLSHLKSGVQKTNETTCARNGPKTTLNACRSQFVTIPWRIVTTITTLNDSPKRFMYGAVHGLKYGVANTDTCRNDRRPFHTQVVKSCSISNLRRHKGRNYFPCRFEIISKRNAKQNTESVTFRQPQLVHPSCSFTKLSTDPIATSRWRYRDCHTQSDGLLISLAHHILDISRPSVTCVKKTVSTHGICTKCRVLANLCCPLISPISTVSDTWNLFSSSIHKTRGPCLRSIVRYACIRSVRTTLQSRRQYPLQLEDERRMPQVTSTLQTPPRWRSSGPTEVVQQRALTQHVVASTRYTAGQLPSLLGLAITNESDFVDKVTTNAPLGHTDHPLLTCDFTLYWARTSEPQTWMLSFCGANFSGREHYVGLYSAPATSSHPNLSRRNYEQPLADLAFTVEDIRQLLHNINPFYAFGPDEVHPRILKETTSTMAKISTSFQASTQAKDEDPMSDAIFFYSSKTFARVPHLPLPHKLGSYGIQGRIPHRAKTLLSDRSFRRAATKMVDGLKSVDYETQLAVLDLFSLECRRLRGDLILNYALFEQVSVNRFFTVAPANTRRGHDATSVSPMSNSRPCYLVFHYTNSHWAKYSSCSLMHERTIALFYRKTFSRGLNTCPPQRAWIVYAHPGSISAHVPNTGTSRLARRVSHSAAAYVRPTLITNRNTKEIMKSFSCSWTSTCHAKKRILPGCPSLDRGSRDTEVGCEPQLPAVAFHCAFRARRPKWLERELTDRKVRGSNPTSASRLPLSRLGQPGSIPALVQPSGGMAVRHRKGATAERFSGLRKTRTPRSVIEKLEDTGIKQNYQNSLLKRLSDSSMLDIKGHCEQTSKALLRARLPVSGDRFPPGHNHNSTRRIIRLQVELRVRSDREAWWTRKAEEMEDAKHAGNVPELFHLTRSAGPRKPLVSEISKN